MKEEWQLKDNIARRSKQIREYKNKWRSEEISLWRQKSREVCRIRRLKKNEAWEEGHVKIGKARRGKNIREDRKLKIRSKKLLKKEQ